nr:MAG TPA: nucelotide kinase [Crassvirales sp.]
MKQEIKNIKNIISSIIDTLQYKKNINIFPYIEPVNVGILLYYAEQLQKEVSELEKIYNYNNSQELISKPKETTQKDNVNHPSHYQGSKYECIDVMLDVFGKEKVSAFCELNAFKYQWRANSKGTDIQDKQKAIWYNQEYIELNTDK